MGVEISLTGKNAIVTGGGGGMGRCTARMLARAGANVLVSDMDGAEAEETVAQIKAESDVKALSMVCNVTSKADIDRMVAAALDAFGSTFSTILPVYSAQWTSWRQRKRTTISSWISIPRALSSSIRRY